MSLFTVEPSVCATHFIHGRLGGWTSVRLMGHIFAEQMDYLKSHYPRGNCYVHFSELGLSRSRIDKTLLMSLGKLTKGYYIQDDIITDDIADFWSDLRVCMLGSTHAARPELQAPENLQVGTFFKSNTPRSFSRLDGLSALTLHGAVDIGNDCQFLPNGSSLVYLDLVRPSIRTIDGLESRRLESFEVAYASKLESLDGITASANSLALVGIRNCKKITSYTPFFRCHNIQQFDLWNSAPIESIQFIEQMQHLQVARINDTLVADLRVLGLKNKLGKKLIVYPMKKTYV